MRRKKMNKACASISIRKALCYMSEANIEATSLQEIGKIATASILLLRLLQDIEVERGKEKEDES